MRFMPVLVAAAMLSLAGPGRPAQAEVQFWFNVNIGTPAVVADRRIIVVQEPVYVPETVFVQRPIVVQGIGPVYYFNGRYYAHPLRYTQPMTQTMKVKFRGPSGAFVPPGQAKKHPGGHPGRGHGKGHKNK